MYLPLMFDRKCVTLHTLKLLHLKPTQIPMDQKSLLKHILRILRSFLCSSCDVTNPKKYSSFNLQEVWLVSNNISILCLFLPNSKLDSYVALPIVRILSSLINRKSYYRQFSQTYNFTIVIAI